MNQKRKVLKLMDAIIARVMNTRSGESGKNAQRRQADQDHLPPSGGGIFSGLAFIAAVVLWVVPFKENLLKEASVGRDPTPTAYQQVLHNIVSDNGAASQEAAPEGYTPLDAARRKGVYQQPDLQERIREDNSTIATEIAGRAGEPLNGFGKQLFSLYNEESARNSLIKALQLYPDEQGWLLIEQLENGNLLYKGVIGYFQDSKTAKKAFPELNKIFPGSFPVNLEGYEVNS